MRALTFELKSIPDLSLVKYSTLGARGVGGVLDAHLAFLRLFAHRPNTSLHLFYVYDPTRPDGERMSVHLAVAQGDEQGAVGLDDVEEIVLSSPLAHYFDLRPCHLGGDETLRPGQIVSLLGPRSSAEKGAPPMRFSHLASLSKRARFMRTSDNPVGYFGVPPYEGNEESRLYAMMRLMQNLDLPVALRVDLHPTERATTLRDSLPLAEVWQRSQRSLAAHDYALDQVERSYEDLLDSLEGSPLFHVNAVALARDAEIARAVLDAAASEAVGKGSLDVALYEGEFDVFSLMAPLGPNEVRASADGSMALVARRDASGGPCLPGFTQVDARASSYAQRDVCNLFTLEDAACLFRLPVLNEGEAVQLRKETAPSPVPGENNLLLGADSFGQRAYFELRKLNKHAFISGVPGSGKTNTMLHLATTLVNRGVPILVLEPAKHEYRALLNVRLAQEVRVFSPGGDLAFPIRINPFQIPYGVTVGQHISRLCEVFGASFPLTESLPFLLDRSIETIYRRHGWLPKDCSQPGDSRGWPTLTELYEQMGKEVESESYAGEVRGNLQAVLRVRIGSLLRRELGEVLDVPVSTYEPNEWLRMSAVVELESLGHDEANFLTLLLLTLLRECLMVNAVYEGDLPVRHVIFVEEAHNLVAPKAERVSGNDADPKVAATVLLSDMLREVRAYDEGIVIADQLPTAIAPEVLKNTGLKVGLRMTSADDRSLLGSMMAASGVQLERMVTADPGCALVLYEGLQRPFEIRMAEWLGTPGTPEYVESREERALAATPLAASELAARLVSEDAPWYRALRLAVPRNDADAVRAQIAAADRRYAPVFEAIERLERELPGVLDDEEAHRALLEEVDAALHEALGTWPLAQDGTPLLPNLNPVTKAYNAAKDALNERARGWEALGMPTFAETGNLPAGTLLRPRMERVERRAVREYTDCAALFAERTVRLWDAGMERFGGAYAHPGGAREFDEMRRKMSNYARISREAMRKDDEISSMEGVAGDAH